MPPRVWRRELSDSVIFPGLPVSPRARGGEAEALGLRVREHGAPPRVETIHMQFCPIFAP